MYYKDSSAGILVANLFLNCKKFLIIMDAVTRYHVLAHSMHLQLFHVLSLNCSGTITNTMLTLYFYYMGAIAPVKQ